MKKTSDRDRVIRIFTQYLTGSLQKRGNKNDNSLSSAKEFLSAMASLAGQGKDELVQVICREIGTATAMVLKEPLAKLLEDKRIQITIELVPNESPNKKPRKKSTIRVEDKD